jgi:hypothetical protein
MSTAPEHDVPSLQRIQRIALIVGAAGTALSLLGALLDATQFFRSYLVAFNCFLAVALGSLAVRMLHNLTGGRWGVILQRWLEAASRTLPLLLLFFVPVVLGVYHLYIWTDLDDPDVPTHLRELLEKKEFYLNLPFFLVRAAIYFAVWLVLAYLVNKWSGQLDRDPSPELAQRLEQISGPGLLLYGLTMTFAAIDWTMSLDPEWYSTIFGVLVATGQMLPAFALGVAGMAWLLTRRAVSEQVEPQVWNDLGSLLLAFVMIWTYMSFAQLLLIWSGNLPEEIVWYERRATGGWQGVAVILAVFYFGLPFVILLSRNFKRDPARLLRLASGIVVVSVVYQFWLVAPAPAFPPRRFSLHWLDVTTLAALGGFWVAVFIWQLQARPLLPVHDPLTAEAVHHA